MDEGSSLNILYVETLDAMGILGPSSAPLSSPSLGSPTGELPSPYQPPTKHLSKVLMDEGSSLNILYVETLDAMGILGPSSAPLSSPSLGSSQA
jgi:hypothetical protein